VEARGPHYQIRMQRVLEKGKAKKATVKIESGGRDAWSVQIRQGKKATGQGISRRKKEDIGTGLERSRSGKACRGLNVRPGAACKNWKQKWFLSGQNTASQVQMRDNRAREKVPRKEKGAADLKRYKETYCALRGRRQTVANWIRRRGEGPNRPT